MNDTRTPAQGHFIDYLPTYRLEIVTRIMHTIVAGDSCSIVGASGMAKSNLFRRLLNPEVRQHYLGDAWRSYPFLAIDSHALTELSERAMYDLLLERLAAVMREQAVGEDLAAMVEELHQQTLPSVDPLAWQRTFTKAVWAVMNADATRHLVFLFDQLDEVYETLNPRFFANLRAIRDQHKYRLSYVTFTREVLPRISQAPESEEFYELLSPNVIGLGPYNREDAWTLLRRVGGRYGVEPDATLGDRLIALTGGHPGLLRAAYMTTLWGSLTLTEADPEAIQTLLANADVRTECLKLWESIGEDEQMALADIAADYPLEQVEQEAVRLLRLKGLVMESDAGQAAIFCRLFEDFVNQPEVFKAVDIRLDRRSGKVWVEGRAVSPDLTAAEFALLSYLFERRGEICSKSELKALYPEGSQDVDALINQLRRKIESDPRRPKYILTVRGKGFQLAKPATPPGR